MSLEEGVEYRVDRNGNVKRVKDDAVTAPKKAKSGTNDKSEQVAAD